MRDKAAALKVAGHGRGDFQHHFNLFGVEPDTVLLRQDVMHAGVGGEGVQGLQVFNLGERPRLELVAVFACQIQMPLWLISLYGSMMA